MSRPGFCKNCYSCINPCDRLKEGEPMYKVINSEGKWFVVGPDSKEECESEERALGKAQLLNNMLKHQANERRLKDQRALDNQKTKQSYRLKPKDKK